LLGEVEKLVLRGVEMRIEPLLKANEYVKKMVRLLSINLKMGEKEREILRKDISEIMKLVREVDRFVLNLSKEEIYMVGKILGRIETLYALIAKGVIESKR